MAAPTTKKPMERLHPAGLGMKLGAETVLSATPGSEPLKGWALTTEGRAMAGLSAHGTPTF